MAENRIPLFVPVPPNADGTEIVIVGVQGKLYNLPVGKTSYVPEAVYKEYMRAQEANAVMIRRRINLSVDKQ